MPGMRQRGNRWQIHYVDATGRRRFQSFTSQEAAEGALAKRRAERELLDGEGRGTETKTFRALAELWIEVKHRKRSLADDESRLRVHLLPAFGDLALAEITGLRVQMFERDLSHRVSTGTVRLVLALLKSMLRLAVRYGWLSSAPYIALPQAEDHDYQWIETREEIEALLQAATETEYPGLMPLYATAVFTGMRAGELCGLQWADVSFSRRLITVQRSFDRPTKSGKIRRVPILDALLPILTAWKDEAVHPDLVFPNRRGRMHVKGARAVSQTYHRCLRAAGMERMRFHALRHTFASHWVMNGGDLYRLQRILGHQGVTMTQRYAHLAPDVFAQDWGRMGSR